MSETVRKIYRTLLPQTMRKGMREKRFALRISADNLLFGERYPYRRFNDRHRLIFVHIPKNAGTSILSFLNDGRSISQEHNTYFDYLKADHTRFARYFKFAVVRNPWDRLLSAYSYLRAGGNGGTDRAFCERMNAEVTDFRHFVNDWLDCDRLFAVKVLNPQFHYLYDIDGVCRVDRLLRYENLTHEFEAMVSELGLKGTLPHSNRSTRGDYPDYYDEETVAKVARLYRRDIELFDYRFGDRV